MTQIIALGLGARWARVVLRQEVRDADPVMSGQQRDERPVVAFQAGGLAHGFTSRGKR
jgi:hypothetical protein